MKLLYLCRKELGKLIGVQKAQISRLENNTSNVTIETLLRVFTALKAQALIKEWATMYKTDIMNMWETKVSKKLPPLT